MDFSAEDLHRWLDAVDDSEIDRLDYGVIGIDAEGKTCRYSNFEAKLAGLDRKQVLGRPFFVEIARCMNNGLVGRRFLDARAHGEVLDAQIDYVLAFRSQTTPVRLRLLARPDILLDYLLVRPIATPRQ